MSSSDKSRLILIETNAQGVSVRRPISGKLVIPAKTGFNYTVVEESTAKPPAKIRLRRTGNVLVVEQDGTVVSEIENFYDEKAVSYSTDGSATVTGSGSHITPSSPSVSSLPGGDSLVWPSSSGAADAAATSASSSASGMAASQAMPAWGYVAAGFAGLAVAGGGGSGGASTGGGGGGLGGDGDGGGGGGGAGGSGLVTDDGIGGAAVTISYYDAAGNLIETLEVTSNDDPTSAEFGQFPIDLDALGYDGTGFITATAVGGRDALGNQLNGATVYKVIVTDSSMGDLDAGDEFLIVLSPISTLIYESVVQASGAGMGDDAGDIATLLAGVDPEAAIRDATGEIVDLLGLTGYQADPVSLLKTASDFDPTRQVIERQVNLLLTSMTSLGSGLANGDDAAANLSLASGASRAAAAALLQATRDHAATGGSFSGSDATLIQGVVQEFLTVINDVPEVDSATGGLGLRSAGGDGVDGTSLRIAQTLANIGARLEEDGPDALLALSLIAGGDASGAGTFNLAGMLARAFDTATDAGRDAFQGDLEFGSAELDAGVTGDVFILDGIDGTDADDELDFDADEIDEALEEVASNAGFSSVVINSAGAFLDLDRDAVLSSRDADADLTVAGIDGLTPADLGAGGNASLSERVVTVVYSDSAIDNEDFLPEADPLAGINDDDRIEIRVRNFDYSAGEYGSADAASDVLGTIGAGEFQYIIDAAAQTKAGLRIFVETTAAGDISSDTSAALILGAPDASGDLLADGSVRSILVDADADFSNATALVAMNGEVTGSTVASAVGHSSQAALILATDTGLDLNRLVVAAEGVSSNTAFVAAVGSSGELTIGGDVLFTATGEGASIGGISFDLSGVIGETSASVAAEASIFALSGDLTVEGDFNLDAAGECSDVTVALGGALSGDLAGVSLQGEVGVTASGQYASATFVVANASVNLGSDLDVTASGDGSSATMLVYSSDLTFDGEITVAATGDGASASADFNDVDFAGGGLTVTASGLSSDALLSADAASGTVGDITVTAGGADTSAELYLSSDVAGGVQVRGAELNLSSDLAGGLQIAGDVAVTASGTSAGAFAEIYGADFGGGNLVVTASGESAEAFLSVDSASGTIADITVTASSADSSAELYLSGATTSGSAEIQGFNFFALGNGYLSSDVDIEAGTTVRLTIDGQELTYTFDTTDVAAYACGDITGLLASLNSQANCADLNVELTAEGFASGLFLEYTDYLDHALATLTVTDACGDSYTFGQSGMDYVEFDGAAAVNLLQINGAVEAQSDGGSAYTQLNITNAAFTDAHLTVTAASYDTYASIDLNAVSGAIGSYALEAVGDSSYAGTYIHGSSDLEIDSMSIVASGQSATATAYVGYYGGDYTDTTFVSALTVEASGQDSEAYLYADASGDVTFDGASVSVTASGLGSHASADIGNASGTVGNITVTASSADSSAELYLSSEVVGATTINGTVAVTASGFSAEASAEIFNAGFDGANLVVTASGESAEAYLSVDSASGTIADITVTASSADSSAELYLSGVATKGSAELQGFDFFGGDLLAAGVDIEAGTTVRLTIDGQELTYTFDTTDVAAYACGDITGLLASLNSQANCADLSVELTAYGLGLGSGLFLEYTDYLNHALATLTVTDACSDSYTFGESVGMCGDYIEFDGAAAVNLLQINGDVAVTASGFSAEASAEIYGADFGGGNITVTASGDSSDAFLSVDAAGGTIVDITVTASGADTSAELNLSSEVVGGLQINGDVAVAATGFSAEASAEISGADFGGGNITVTASGTSSDAFLSVEYAGGTIGDITVATEPGQVVLSLNTLTSLDVDSGRPVQDHIENGSNDAYDTGNFISVTSSDTDAIVYSVGSVVSDDFGIGSERVVVYQPGLFGLMVTGNSENNFYVLGDLGADGYGAEDILQLGTYNGHVAYAQRTYFGGDSSINRVFIAEGDGSDLNITALDGDTGTDDFHIAGLSSVASFGYFVAFGDSDAPYDQTALTAFFHSVVDDILSEATVADMKTAFDEQYASLASGLTGLVVETAAKEASARLYLSADASGLTIDGNVTVSAGARDDDASAEIHAAEFVDSNFIVNASGFSSEAYLSVEDARGAIGDITVTASGGLSDAFAAIAVREGTNEINSWGLFGTPNSPEFAVAGDLLVLTLEGVGSLEYQFTSDDVQAMALLDSNALQAFALRVNLDLNAQLDALVPNAHIDFYALSDLNGLFTQLDLTFGDNGDAPESTLGIVFDGDPPSLYVSTYGRQGSPNGSVAIDGNVTVIASGLSTDASAEIFGADFGGGNITVIASGKSSDAFLSADDVGGTITNIVVEASGLSADASVEIDGDYTICGDVTVLASGRYSSADLGLHGLVEFADSEILVRASGYSADASLDVGAAIGHISDLDVLADGTDSLASAEINALQGESAYANYSIGSTSGADNLATAGVGEKLVLSLGSSELVYILTTEDVAAMASLDPAALSQFDHRITYSLNEQLADQGYSNAYISFGAQVNVDQVNGNTLDANVYLRLRDHTNHPEPHLEIRDAANATVVEFTAAWSEDGELDGSLVIGPTDLSVVADGFSAEAFINIEGAEFDDVSLTLTATGAQSVASADISRATGTITDITLTAVEGGAYVPIFYGSTEIDDGIDDQYDSGNRLSVNLTPSDSDYIVYSSDVNTGEFGADSSHVTSITGSAFGFFVSDNSAASFAVTGGTGADGQATQFEELIELGDHAGYSAVAYRTAQGEDEPVVDRVFIYKSNADVQFAPLDNDANTEDFKVSGLDGVTTFAHFVLFADSVTGLDTQDLIAFFEGAVDQFIAPNEDDVAGMRDAFELGVDTVLGSLSSFEPLLGASGTASLDIAGDITVTGDITLTTSGFSAELNLEMSGGLGTSADLAGVDITFYGSDITLTAVGESHEVDIRILDGVGSLGAITVDSQVGSADIEVDIDFSGHLCGDVVITASGFSEEIDFTLTSGYRHQAQFNYNNGSSNPYEGFSGGGAFDYACGDVFELAIGETVLTYILDSDDDSVEEVVAGLMADADYASSGFQILDASQYYDSYYNVTHAQFYVLWDDYAYQDVRWESLSTFTYTPVSGDSGNSGDVVGTGGGTISRHGITGGRDGSGLLVDDQIDITVSAVGESGDVYAEFDNVVGTLGSITVDASGAGFGDSATIAEAAIRFTSGSVNDLTLVTGEYGETAAEAATASVARLSLSQTVRGGDVVVSGDGTATLNIHDQLVDSIDLTALRSGPNDRWGVFNLQLSMADEGTVGTLADTDAMVVTGFDTDRDSVNILIPRSDRLREWAYDAGDFTTVYYSEEVTVSEDVNDFASLAALADTYFDSVSCGDVSGEPRYFFGDADGDGYLFYDIDGGGVDGVIHLDGVTVSEFSAINVADRQYYRAGGESSRGIAGSDASGQERVFTTLSEVSYLGQNRSIAADYVETTWIESLYGTTYRGDLSLTMTGDMVFRQAGLSFVANAGYEQQSGGVIFNEHDGYTSADISDATGTIEHIGVYAAGRTEAGVNGTALVSINNDNNSAPDGALAVRRIDVSASADGTATLHVDNLGENVQILTVAAVEDSTACVDVDFFAGHVEELVLYADGHNGPAVINVSINQTAVGGVVYVAADVDPVELPDGNISGSATWTGTGDEYGGQLPTRWNINVGVSSEGESFDIEFSTNPLLHIVGTDGNGGFTRLQGYLGNLDGHYDSVTDFQTAVENALSDAILDGDPSALTASQAIIWSLSNGVLTADVSAAGLQYDNTGTVSAFQHPYTLSYTPTPITGPLVTMNVEYTGASMANLISLGGTDEHLVDAFTRVPDSVGDAGASYFNYDQAGTLLDGRVFNLSLNLAEGNETVGTALLAAALTLRGSDLTDVNGDDTITIDGLGPTLDGELEDSAFANFAAFLAAADTALDTFDMFYGVVDADGAGAGNAGQGFLAVDGDGDGITQLIVFDAVSSIVFDFDRVVTPTIPV